MKRILLVALLLLVLLVGATVLWIRQQTRPAPQAIQILPGSTLLLLDLPDLPRTRSGLAKTQAYALWQEPEVQALVEQQRRALAELLGGKPEQVDQNLDQVMEAIEGELFVAVTRLSLLPVPRPSVVVGADLKGNLLKVMAALAYQERQLRSYNPRAQFGNAKHLGVKYATWRFSPQRELYHAFFGSMIVWATDEPTMQELIARWKNKAPAESPALAAAASYREIRAGLPGQAEFVSFFNVEQLTQLAGPLLMQLGTTGNGPLQQLSRIQATGLASNFRDGQVLDTGFTIYKTANTNLPAPTAARTLPLTGPDTLLYAVQATDWATSYQGLLDSLAANPKAAAAAMQFERLLRRQEIRPREDFFGLLGPETAVLAGWREGAKLPELALAIELRDPAVKARIGSVMEALKNAMFGADSGLEWEKTTQQGRELVTLRLGAGLVAPTYTVTDNLLLICSNPDYARSLTGAGAGVLAGPLRQAMPANAHEYFYCDLGRLLRPVYGTVRANYPKLDPPLPQTETIVKHLSPYLSATITEARSETTTALSPLGKPFTALGVAAGVVGAVAPSLPPLPDLGAPPLSRGLGRPEK